MKCKHPCLDDHPLGEGVWHRAYCSWFDHKHAGHRLRAAVWGWFADRIVRWA